MNFIENETPQKLRGGYYTPPDIARFLIRWALPAGRPLDVLEPSCGDGAFLRALAAAEAPAQPGRLVACERDPAEAALAAGAHPRVQVRAGDFLAQALAWLEDDDPPGFDAVIGNPPFIRYQYLDAALQDRAERLIRRFGLRFTRHTNAWVPFVVASLALLRPGGRLAMVVPAELLHVLHAQSARAFLLRTCSRVLVLDPAEIWFEGTLQGVILLLAEKKAEPSASTSAQVAIRPVSGRAFLQADPRELVDEADYTDGGALPGKWMLALLGARERSLIQALRDHPRVLPFSEAAAVSVGIVTGANRFFLVPDATVSEFSLAPFARPMFGRSEHVPGVLYDDAVHQANRDAGLPANFICFGADASGPLPEGARRYIARGEAEGLHRRYKCRIREPWYAVPSVFTAPVAMLKRCHDHPRLVLNTAGAYTTDTAYRIVPAAMSGPQLVWAFVNSLTALTAELEGRHYGGGVLELVPSEIRRLLVPSPTMGEGALERLDASCRAGLPAAELLARQDAAVLRPLGLTPEDTDTLAGAWRTPRDRRQRSR